MKTAHCTAISSCHWQIYYLSGLSPVCHWRLMRRVVEQQDSKPSQTRGWSAFAQHCCNAYAGNESSTMSPYQDMSIQPVFQIACIDAAAKLITAPIAAYAR